MNPNTNKEKFLALVEEKPSDLVEKAKWEEENAAWLRKSAQIAFNILRYLRQANLSQKELAERMNMSPQQLSKILKGQENLTLETIVRVEKALDIALIKTVDADTYLVKINQPAFASNDLTYQVLWKGQSDFKYCS